MGKLFTSGDMANNLKVHRDKVSYAIRALNLKPVQRAGHVRLFSRSQSRSVGDFIRSRNNRKTA